MRRVKRIKLKRLRRKRRVRRTLRGNSTRPRLTVHRSNKHIYAQLIDDEAGRTLCAASSRTVCGAYGGTVEHAGQVGAALAEAALGMDVKQIKFDRGPYKYHGRIKALADAAREKGLEF